MRKSRREVAANLTPEEEPELIVDLEFRSPRPLDRNISTVSLTTPTNNVTEGYDLQLSATFGKERVVLLSEDFEIEVDFSMNKANIELSFHHCEYTQIDDSPRVEEYKRKITEHVDKNTSALAKLSAHFSGGPSGVTSKADADGSVQHSAAASSTMKQEIVRYDWHRLGGDAILVGGISNPLQGPMITNFRGWRVMPQDSGRISGVVARVKVREHWINFDNVQVLKHPPGLLSKVKSCRLITAGSNTSACFCVTSCSRNCGSTKTELTPLSRLMSS